MKTIIWDGRHGLVFPEGRVREEAPTLVEVLNSVGVVYIGQHTLFNELRLAVKRGEVDGPVQLQLGNGCPIPIDRNGTLKYWPSADGFDLVDAQLNELIGL